MVKIEDLHAPARPAFLGEPTVPGLEGPITHIRVTFGLSLGTGEKREKKRKSWVYSNTLYPGPLNVQHIRDNFSPLGILANKINGKIIVVQLNMAD